MRKFVLCLGIAAFLLPVCLSSCQKEEPKDEPKQTDNSFVEISANGVKFTMVLVEHGSFVKGEMTKMLFHTPVILTKDYYIGEYEVTQELWEAVMGAESNPSVFKGGNLPVNNISWNDCNAFINKLNEITGKSFRLPTECEWEFAARGDIRKKNGGKPVLHASVSAKWTIRSDRAQNSRTEALNLIRNRKGHLPHIVVVTGEPLPSRLASLALGTGDIDCVYHFALYELMEAVKSVGDESANEMLGILINGKRLKDISDLPLDLAV